jgi:putative ABC transport system permease protein
MVMAWRNLSRRKLRTGLTVAGIAVGVALILVLLSLVAGIDVQVRSSIRSLGGADITVYNGTVTGVRQSFLFGSSATLNESLVGEIGNLPNVYSVSPESLEVVSADGALAPVWGIDPQTFDRTTGGLNIIDGRQLNVGDENAVVLGKELQQFLNLSLGGNLLVQGRPPHDANNVSLTIVGVYETGQNIVDRGLYVQRGIVLNLTDSQGTVTSILVKVNDPNLVSSVSDEISTLFPETRVVTPANIIAQSSQLLNTLTLFFATIGVVALVAGSFGVINTMLISVFERTKEIGTMKAIGAKQTAVLKMFVYEAIAIGCLGGIIGLLIGGFSSFALSEFAGRVLPAVGKVGARVVPVLTLENLALSFILGAATGTVAGLYPAWRAARMKIVEALRHA